MKKLLFSVLLSICISPVFGQFGLRAGYQINEMDDFQALQSSTEATYSLPGDGFSIGVDYWFRLKNIRIEFMPELNYSQFTNTIGGEELATEITGNWYSFNFNTHIYLLDIINDCNCPTFSKQSDFFQKGFFLLLSPGITLPTYQVDGSQLATLDGESLDPYFNVALGLGLDIGISDLVTVSPIISARYSPSVSWDNYAPIATDIPALGISEGEASLWQYYAGLRLGLRFDRGY